MAAMYKHMYYGPRSAPIVVRIGNEYLAVHLKMPVRDLPLRGLTSWHHSKRQGVYVNGGKYEARAPSGT